MAQLLSAILSPFYFRRCRRLNQHGIQIAMRQGFITPQQCYALGEELAKSPYGEYVMSVARLAGA